MSDYLWNKSGEPDAEVKRLEEALAPLRYKHQPLRLPANVNHKRRSHWLPLAIAATVVLAILGGVGSGLLYRNSRQQEVEIQSAATPNDTATDDQKREVVERAAHERSVSQETSRPQSNLSQETLNPNRDSSRSYRSNIVRYAPTHKRRESSGVVLSAQRGRKARTAQQTVAADNSQLTPQQQDEVRDGELAKEQLMLALHITSRKLDLAQRRMQEATSQPSVPR